MVLLMQKTIDIADPVLLRIAALAVELGLEVWVVGGFVRDSFLGKSRKDIDITVVGDPIDFAHRIAAVFKTTPVIYERFRTAMVPCDGHHIEIVGTRVEHYNPATRKPSTAVGTLEDDLRRRDFTINSMAASLQPESLGNVIDMFDGISDINGKTLRTPLDPDVTMADDPLRMMRAARFAAQLGFSITDETQQAITKQSERITIISQERITDELLKILGSSRPGKGLKILFDTGLLRHIFPELNSLSGVDLVTTGESEYRHKDVLLHTLRVVDNLAHVSDNLWLRFAALVHDIAKPRTRKFIPETGWSFHGHEEIGARWQDRIFRKLKLPLEHLEYVKTLVRLHQRPMALVDEGVTDSAIRRLAVQAGDTLEDLFTLCRADITTKNHKLAERYLHNYENVYARIVEVRDRDNLKAFQSPVRGDEIMQIAGLDPGPQVGYCKYMIEEAILEGTIPNDHDHALTFLLANMATWINEADPRLILRRSGR